ncbi:MAG: glycosyltransferase [Saprospiraceae bacterium]
MNQQKKVIALVANSTWNIYNFRLNLINKFIAEGMDVVVIAPVDEYLTYKEKYPVRHYSLRMMDRDATNPIKDTLALELIRRYKKIKAILYCILPTNQIFTAALLLKFQVSNLLL